MPHSLRKDIQNAFNEQIKTLLNEQLPLSPEQLQQMQQMQESFICETSNTDAYTSNCQDSQIAQALEAEHEKIMREESVILFKQEESTNKDS